jgi:hypothetical protein
LQKAIDTFGDGGASRKEGWYPELSNMITGSGFVSIGPGYRHYVFNNAAFIDASAAASWHFYKMGQARIEAPDLKKGHLAIGAQAMWQDSTQINYFGIGSDTSEDLQSQYRLKGSDYVGYATIRPNGWLSIGGELGWLRRPKVSSPGGTFRSDFPSATVQFPEDPGMSLSFQPTYLHSELSLTADTRDFRGHPTTGSLYRAVISTYSDRSTDTFSFRQYEAEGAEFIRLKGPTWILAVRGWMVLSDVADGHAVPFYLMPSLGGHSTLRAFSNFRFHDENLANVSVESRWALWTHLDGAVFFDAGDVAPRAGDLDLAKTAIGAGLRLHTQRTTWGRLDVAHGAEGWHFVLRTSDPFRLSHVTRRVAGVPFVP